MEYSPQLVTGCQDRRRAVAELLQYHTVTDMGYTLRHMTCHSTRLSIVKLLQYHTVSDSGIQFATYDLSWHEVRYSEIVTIPHYNRHGIQFAT